MSAGANGLADRIARERIEAHAGMIRDLRGDIEKVEDQVSEVRRYIAEVKPFIVSLRKIAFAGTLGILGVLGAEVWRLILARQ